MINTKEFNSFARIGTLPHRSYYIPFSEADKVSTVFGIIDRKSSSRFTSLDGEWFIKQHENIDSVILEEELTEKIPVPSCVQLHGYDQIQYINVRYPMPVLYPNIP